MSPLKVRLCLNLSSSCCARRLDQTLKISPSIVTFVLKVFAHCLADWLIDLFTADLEFDDDLYTRPAKQTKLSESAVPVIIPISVDYDGDAGLDP